MSKLYFRYGCVDSAKTLNLLAVAHTYREQGKHILIVKPSIDTRFGSDKIQSKAPLGPINTDVSLDPSALLDRKLLNNVACILVDESQFLAEHQVEDLRDIATVMDIHVICYGLRTDFLTHTFAGSKRLLELADSITEVKTTCFFCNSKAIFSGRKAIGDSSYSSKGDQIILGDADMYTPLCSRCYSLKTR